MQKVMIHPADYDAVRPAVDRAFDLFPMTLAGKRVLIKPNVLRSSEAGEGIVTHPAVLTAVVAKVASYHPAQIIVGDNPGLVSYGDNEQSFEKTGLMAASGGYYQNIGNDAVQVDFNPAFVSRVSLSKAVLDADVIISLPKFKTHGLTVITGAIKNSYGFLPGGQKARLHRIAGSPERFHEVVVEVFRLRVPDLFIVDAVVGMEGNGPASPDLRKIGLILAGDNAVAVDAVIATMMGLDPARLRFLQTARALGLGDYDMQAIAIDGTLQVLPNFKLPPLGGEAIADNDQIQQMLENGGRVRPKADPQQCTACGTCVDHCPVEALEFVDDLPAVDPETCIACFCCQEICPEKAMSLV